MKSIFSKVKSKFKCLKKKNQWLVDLLEDNPFEFGCSLALIAFGTSALLGGLQSAPTSVKVLPITLLFIYCVLSLLGGLATIFGLIARVRFGWAYGVERFGLFISASAWASYIVGLVLTPLTSRSTLVISALVALSISPLLRARAIDRKARATLTALRYAQKIEGDFDG